MSLRPRPVRGPVRVLVVLWAGAVTLWALPEPPPGYVDGVRKGASPWRNPVAAALDFKELHLAPAIGPFLMWTGTWQNWNMFAPYPANLSIWVDGVATLKSGREVRVLYPRPEASSLPVRFVEERFRKHLESAHKEAHAFLWPTLARWMADRAERPGDPVVRMRLYRHWAEVAPPPGRLGPRRTFLFYDARYDGTRPAPSPKIPEPDLGGIPQPAKRPPVPRSSGGPDPMGQRPFLGGPPRP